MLSKLYHRRSIVKAPELLPKVWQEDEMRGGQRRVKSRQYRKIRLDLTLSADKADRLMAEFWTKLIIPERA